MTETAETGVEMLACPFCGRDAFPFNGGPLGREKWAACYGTKEGARHNYISMPVAEWNTRPTTTGNEELADAQVVQHHRYRSLWEDFQTVEKDLRACALLVDHHYNSLRPVAPAVEAALRSDGVEVARLRAENDRLSKAVCSGVLGELLSDDEATALADFVKGLRSQAALGSKQ